MLRSFKAAILTLCILAIVAIGVFKFDALHMAGAHITNHPHVSRPPTLAQRITASKHANGPAFADGPYTVQGNAIIGADGNRYLFHGVGRDSLEYNCWGDGHFDAQELSYLGAGTTTSSVTYWGAN